MMIARTYDFGNWRENFMDYLRSRGYKPSVVKDYPGRIEKIIDEEGITVQELAADIDRWIAEYKTGKYMNINKSKHYAPSSALIKFKEFFPTLYKPFAESQESIEELSELIGIDPCKLIF